MRPQTASGDIEEFILENVVKLYNGYHSNKTLTISYCNHEIFGNVIPELPKVYHKSDTLEMALNSITITSDRNKIYDFSVPYMPIKEVLISTKSNNITDVRGKTIGYILETLQVISLETVQHLNMKPLGYSTYPAMEKALLQGEVDLIITDNIDTWNNHELIVLHELEHQNGSGYGIMYPKGSPLKQMLNKFIDYFVKSALFLKKVKQYFGKDVSDYFVKELNRKHGRLGRKNSTKAKG